MSFTRVIVSLVTPPLPPVGRALMNRCEGHTGRTGQAMHDRSMWNGWPLFWVLTGLLMLMSAVRLARVGFDTDGYRLVIRFTAQSSLALFLVASVASAVHAHAGRVRSPRGWVRNRRAFGLGFAMSHAIHLLAIITFARIAWPNFWSLSSKGAIIAGRIAYVIIGFLALTSFDAIVRRLGVSCWKRLHRFGIWSSGWSSSSPMANEYPGAPGTLCRSRC